MNGNRSGKWLAFVIVWLVILGGGAGAYRYFFGSGGDGPVGPGPGGFLQVPFILWGGDVATFHANGGLETQKGTLFDQHGLKLKLTRGDDFGKQIEDYTKGVSPFLRGTMSMLGQASESIAKDDNTRPVVFLQMTWSAGDHLVARSGIKTLADLSGKTIVLQEDGPHVGMLFDILKTARFKLTKNANGQMEGDVRIRWTKDVTGPKGPAELFKSDRSIDACFAITPDMLDLAGDPETKKPGSVAGAHVLVSTSHMSRSIADVYACRKDFYDKNRALIEKFTAAYLKACEEIVTMKRNRTPDYARVQQLTQDIFGKEDIKTLDDAKGLIEDAVFVGLPGNRSFFAQKGNLSGFEYKLKAALEVAIALNQASRRYSFHTADFDYNKIKEIGHLSAATRRAEFPKDLKFLPDGTIYSFNIYFKSRQSDFSVEEYGDDFQRALEQASLFGNAALVLRGHTDAISVLGIFCETGKNNELLEADGAAVDTIDIGRKLPIYSACKLKDGLRLNLREPATSKTIVDLVQKDKTGKYAPVAKQINRMNELSQDRAESVKKEIKKYAEQDGVRLEITQIRADGVGMLEPVAPLDKDSTKNRRVEFRIARIEESVTRDFDD